MQAPSLALWRYPYLSGPQFFNPQLWLEVTHLPYPDYDHILSK